MTRFVNADLLAAGLSPLDPTSARIAAGKVFLRELDRLAAARGDFAFESTLSGLTYLPRLRRWKVAGYRIEIFICSSTTCGSRWSVSLPACGPGHDVPEADARRRFLRSRINFTTHYRPLADASWVFDVNGPLPILLSAKP